MRVQSKDVDAVHEGATNSSACAPLLRTLSDLPDGELVGRTIRFESLFRWRPTAVTVRTHDAERQCLDLVAWSGIPPDLLETFASMPVEAATPVGECLRNGRRIDVRVPDLADRFPLMLPWTRAIGHSPEAHLVSVPIRARGSRIGVLTVGFPESPQDPLELQVTLDVISSALALWVVAADPQRLWKGNRRQREEIRLTDRQQQVIIRVAEGWTNLAIANDLNFSVATIKSDLAALMRRFGASDRHDLVERIGRSGLNPEL